MPDIIDQITPPPANASPVATGTPDRKGNPFDPARHIPKMSKHGTWLPRSPGRGGNKSKTAAPSSGSTSSPPESTAPDATANSLPSLPDSPAVPPIEPAPTPAPSFADIEAAAGPTAPVSTPENDKETKAKAALDLEVMETSDDIAEIISNGLYNLCGLIFDAPEEWGLSGAEHNRARKAIAAYIRARGGQISAGKALVFLAAAYALRGLAKPKSRAKAKEWTAYLRARLFPKKNAPLPVAPAPVAATPSAPARASDENFNPDYRAQ